MQIAYHLPDGSRSVFETSSSTTVAGFKQNVAAAQQLDASSMHLTLCGRPLCDEAVFAECGLEGAVEVSVTYDLDGGAKGKKKKKQYTTPKHVPHKRKKVKLAVLKYYTLDGDQIVRNRMNCISKSCGAGVKMAAHLDRAHCGKCGLTLLKKEN